MNTAAASVNSNRDVVDGSFDQRFATLKSIGEDRVNDRELKLLLKKNPAPICYVWCDPSPWMHISQGIMKTLSINKMVKSGFKVKILMADWFAQMNSEIGGNLNKIRTIGRYNIEMWKATGMALDELELVWLSDEISRHGDEYWPLVMDIASRNSVHRFRRSSHFCFPSRYCGSRGLYGTGQLTVADMFYPCLQCAGILFQKADIWLLGMDQHDAYLLARQYCKHVKRKSMPIAVLHNRLPNLLQCPGMENRRHPAWAIFMEDDKEDICFKIEKAFCPPKLAKGNPCLEYIQYIILPWFGKFEVVRKKENGGKKTFLSMEELTADYESGALHSADVKLALVKSLNKILQDGWPRCDFQEYMYGPKSYWPTQEKIQAFETGKEIWPCEKEPRPRCKCGIYARKGVVPSELGYGWYCGNSFGDFWEGRTCDWESFPGREKMRVELGRQSEPLKTQFEDRVCPRTGGWSFPGVMSD